MKDRIIIISKPKAQELFNVPFVNGDLLNYFKEEKHHYNNNKKIKEFVDKLQIEKLISPREIKDYSEQLNLKISYIIFDEISRYGIDEYGAYLISSKELYMPKFFGGYIDDPGMNENDEYQSYDLNISCEVDDVLQELKKIFK